MVPETGERAATAPDVFVSIPSLQADDSPPQVDFISPSSLQAGSVPVTPGSPASSHLPASSPGVVGAPWFLLPPLRLLIHSFHPFSVPSPVAAANSPLQCSWHHFPLSKMRSQRLPWAQPLLFVVIHILPRFAPSLSSPQPGLCPEH